MRGKLREQAETERIRWKRALESIAREQTKQNQKLFGTLAWGRYDGEGGPSEPVSGVHFGLGYLQGFRYAALLAAEVFKLPYEDALRRIHDRINQYEREARPYEREARPRTEA